MSNEDYCRRILNSYSIIVDFEGEPPRTNVPAAIEDETFKRWKERVLGPNATNVVVYIPQEPAPQTKISTLKNLSSALHLANVLRTFGKQKDQQKHQAIAETRQEMATFPKDTLRELLDAHGNQLEPSVREFFQRFLNVNEEDIDTESLLRELIKTYNNVARMFREKG